MKKILFLSQVPPPYYGAAVSSQIYLNILKKFKLDITCPVPTTYPIDLIRDDYLVRQIIKSENHNISIELVRGLFNDNELYDIFKTIKEERIDKQCYHETTTIKDNLIEIMKSCQNFNLKIKILVGNLNTEKINNIRGKFKGL